MRSVLNDIRQASRSLGWSASFTAIAVCTLALGIGSTTAIFTILNAVVLEPLAHPDPERLVSVNHPVPGLNSDWEWGLSSGSYFHFREHGEALEELGPYMLAEMTLADEGGAERVQTAMVGASLFSVLSARPLHGRLLLEEDNVARASPFGVAVLGHDFWRTRFAADPAVLGAVIRVEGIPVEIVGILEAGFDLPDQEVALWLPSHLDPGMYHANSHSFGAIGRLGPGVTMERAQADLERLTLQLPEAVPTAYSESFVEQARFSTVVRPLREQVVGDFDRFLWILLGAVSVVLAIACANVWNLLLVRLDGQRRDIAIRSAIGAGRGDLARRYLAEGVLLALLASAAGLLLAFAGIRLLLAVSPPEIPRLAEIALGWKSVAFAVTVSAGTGIFFGLVPLGRGGADHDALRDGGKGMTVSRGRNATRRVLVVAQVALALVLLTSAGLLLQSFHNLGAVDPGFESEGVLTLQLSLPAMDYPDYAEVADFYRDFSARIEALPGVAGVGAITALPLTGAYQYGCNLVFPADAEEFAPCVHTALMTPGFTEALGIPVRGDVPDWNETGQERAGAVVSQAFADRAWPGEEAVGRSLTAGRSEQPHFRVVGVAADVRSAGLDQPPVEVVYFPMVPVEGVQLWQPPRSMTLVVRTDIARPEALLPPVRSVLLEMDPGIPIGVVRTMDEVVSRSIARTAFAMLLLGVAAAVALLLGAVGLYGVLSYVVGQRRAEIGIRMALGARVQEVSRLIVGHSLALVLIGIALGLLAAVAVTGVLRNLLFEVAPSDPRVLGAVSLVLLGTGFLASWVPARRAARVDPMSVLRSE